MFLHDDIEELLEMEDLVNVDDHVSEGLAEMLPITAPGTSEGIDNSYIDTVVPNQIKKIDSINKPYPLKITESTLLYISAPSIKYNEYIDEGVDDAVVNFGADTNLSPEVRKTILKSSMNKIKLEDAKFQNADINILTDIRLETVSLQKELNSYKKSANEEQLNEINMLCESSLVELANAVKEENDDSVTDVMVQEGVYSLSPIRKCLGRLEKIREDRPDEYTSNADVKKFVDETYDDIKKLSRMTEEDIKKNRRDVALSTILHIIMTIAGAAIVITGPPFTLLTLIIALMLPVVSYTISTLCSEIRASQNSEAVNELTKIEAALKKIDRKKLPAPYAKKIRKMIDRIEDVRTEEGRRRSPYGDTAKESTNDIITENITIEDSYTTESFLESEPIQQVDFENEANEIFESVALSSEFMDINSIY